MQLRIIGLKLPWNQQLQKTGGGHPSFASLLAMPLSACLLSATRLTSGGAGLCLVLAKTGPDAGARGVTAFLVEPAFPGFRVSRDEDKMSLQTSRLRRSMGGRVGTSEIQRMIIARGLLGRGGTARETSSREPAAKGAR